MRLWRRGLELEHGIADRHVVAGTRPGALEGVDEPDPLELARELQLGLFIIQIEPGDQVLDLAPRDAQDSVVAQDPPRATPSATRVVHEVIRQLAAVCPGSHRDLGRQQPDEDLEQHRAHLVDALARCAREAEHDRLTALAAQHGGVRRSRRAGHRRRKAGHELLAGAGRQQVELVQHHELRALGQPVTVLRAARRRWSAKRAGSRERLVVAGFDAAEHVHQRRARSRCARNSCPRPDPLRGALEQAGNVDDRELRAVVDRRPCRARGSMVVNG